MFWSFSDCLVISLVFYIYLTPAPPVPGSDIPTVNHRLLKHTWELKSQHSCCRCVPKPHLTPLCSDLACVRVQDSWVRKKEYNNRETYCHTGTVTCDRAWVHYCHNPNNNTTQPQHCSLVGHKNDCAHHTTLQQKNHQNDRFVTSAILGYSRTYHILWIYNISCSCKTSIKFSARENLILHSHILHK